MLVGLGRLHDVYYVCLLLKVWQEDTRRGVLTAHVYVVDAASQTVSVRLSQKNYIQVIVFYLLAQTKVIYIYIYINLLTVSWKYTQEYKHQ